MINIYTKDKCIQCKMTKSLFDNLHIPYNEINVDSEPKELENLKARGVKRMPFVETKQESWSGFQPSKIQGLV